MFSLIRYFKGPMASLFLLSVGISLLSTSQSVWMNEQHYSTFMVGLVSAAYYLGFVYAAFNSERLILRIAHIRSYAAFAAILSASIVMQGIILEPYLWLFLRLIAGYSTAGLFVVIESWLLCQSDIKNRGSVLALYMVVYYVAQALSQLLLNLGTEEILRLLALCSFFTSLSILPTASTKLPQPEIHEPSSLNLWTLIKLSPSGVMGCLLAGLILAPIYNMLPIYFNEVFDTTAIISMLMFVTIIGGGCFQIPLGKLSDSIDRRTSLIIVLLLFLLSSVALHFMTTSMPLTILACVIFGGSSFAIYPISMSHACDVIDTKDIVSATQGLVLVNSAGMVAGPLLAAGAMGALGNKFGLISYFLVLTALSVIFYGYRYVVGESVSPEDQVEYLPLARATPVSIEIDPRID
jgi:MFS family permease